MIPLIISIAGPSGAGKSTVAKLIEASNPNTLVISLDNYFNDVETFPKVMGLPNWELPSNLNFELLAENLRALKQGNATTLPLYNKRTFERSYITVAPKSVILVEGFLLLANQEIRELLDRKLFIEVDTATQLHRRGKREAADRIAYVELVVIPEYMKYGLHTIHFADIVLDGNKHPEELRAEIESLIY